MPGSIAVSIPLPLEDYQALQVEADCEHRSIEELGAELLSVGISGLKIARSQNGAHRGGLADLMRHAGAISLGKPTGLDNAQIDTDLAYEYSGKE